AEQQELLDLDQPLDLAELVRGQVGLGPLRSLGHAVAHAGSFELRLLALELVARLLVERGGLCGTGLRQERDQAKAEGPLDHAFCVLLSWTSVEGAPTASRHPHLPMPRWSGTKPFFGRRGQAPQAATMASRSAATRLAPPTSAPLTFSM